MKKMTIDWTKPPPPPTTLKEAYELIVVLWQEIVPLRQENAQLKARIAELEEQLRSNSQNSSKPPSSDPPWRSRKKKKEPSPNPRGAQIGHEVHQRPLWSEVDEKVPCYPKNQCSCGGNIVDTGEIEIHQVFEIPRVSPQVVEYHLHIGQCQQCQQRVKGKRPFGVPSGMLGPRALSTVGLFSGQFHLSKRQIEKVFSTCYGLPLCLGTVSNAEGIVSEVLKKPVEAAHEYLQNQPQVGADETGFHFGNADGQNPEEKRGWLWVAVSQQVTVFKTCLSRGQIAARALLGESFSGYLHCDRWSGYNWLPAKQKQLCWGHLKREFVKITERGGRSAQIGEALLAEERELFRYWHRVRDGTLKRSTFCVYARLIRQRFKALLEEGATYPTRKGDKSPCAKTARTCKGLLKAETSLWTFVRIEGVEPTNNASERALRPFVLWRKKSQSIQSERGCRFAERIMTVTETCRQQGRNLLDYLTEAVEAHLKGEEIPSLLPENSIKKELLLPVGS